MALLWQQRSGGNRYEVRSAGRTRRLYTNGVCHSDYHPGRAVTRSVWDCLFLPALLREPEEIQRALVLGVGGGSVMHLLQQHLPAATVVGVELSAVHIYVAETWFGLHGAEVHEADAADWLQHYDGPAFDIIVDDLFLEEGSEAHRAIDMDAAWLRLLLQHLAPQGILSVNFPDTRALKQSAWFTHKTLRRRLPAAFVLHTPMLNNAVGAFCRFAADRRRLNRHLAAIPALARAQKTGQLRYSMRRLQNT